MDQQLTTVEAVLAHFPDLKREAIDGERTAKLIIDRSANLWRLLWRRNPYPVLNAQGLALLSLIVELRVAAELGEFLSRRMGTVWPVGWAYPESLRRSADNMITELNKGTYDKLFTAPCLGEQLLKVLVDELGPHRAYKLARRLRDEVNADEEWDQLATALAERLGEIANP